MDRRTFMHVVGATAVAITSANLQAQPAKAPDFTLNGSDDKSHRIGLNDFAGKVCLVSFFTSGCNLCTRDLKLMREFYFGNMQRGFVLLGVNMDERAQDFQEYMRIVSLSVPPEQRFPIVWRNAKDHTDSFGRIVKRPTHFVLDRQHKLVTRREGTFLPDDWDDLWTQLG